MLIWICLLNTLYRYLLNAYIDKYSYGRLLNTYINVSNKEVHKCLNTYIDKCPYKYQPFTWWIGIKSSALIESLS